MVVVLGGVGNLWGTLLGALTLGRRQQAARADHRRRARQDRAAGLHHPVHSEAAARPVRAQGPGGGGMSATTRPRSASSSSSLLALARHPRAGAGAGDARRLRLRHPALSRAAARQISLLRDPRARARSGLGLLRHPVARPRRLLRARRLCDGHVSDAPDRHARRLRQSDPARLHGVPELEGAAGRLVGLQLLRLRRC